MTTTNKITVNLTENEKEVIYNATDFIFLLVDNLEYSFNDEMHDYRLDISNPPFPVTLQENVTSEDLWNTLRVLQSLSIMATNSNSLEFEDF